MVDVVERLELSQRYTALDGVSNSLNEHNPIRSDVRAILDMKDDAFGEWYLVRKTAVERLIGFYEAFSTIPDLSYGSEEQQLTVGRSLTAMDSHIDQFRKGLEHLEKLKEFRDKYWF